MDQTKGLVLVFKRMLGVLVNGRISAAFHFSLVSDCLCPTQMWAEVKAGPDPIFLGSAP